MLPANEPFCMWSGCDRAADDVSGTLMEVLGRARIEQVDFLREALHKLAQALRELEVAQHLPGFAL